jgi:hypothetical protein
VETRLEWVNGDGFLIGSQVIFEISLKNVGRSDLSIPWSTERITKLGPDQDQRQMTLSVLTVDDFGVEHLLAGITLYSSELLPFTYLTLPPGETASVRAPAWLRLSSYESREKRFFNTLPRSVELRPGFWMTTTGPADWSERLTSKNSIPIVLGVSGQRR